MRLQNFTDFSSLNSTNLYKKSVINMGIQLYNKVPNNIKKVEEYKPYKKTEIIPHRTCILFTG